MFKLFRNLKPMAVLLVLIVGLVAGQAIAELYLPEKMSEIIDNGIYLDYEPQYKSLKMEKPDSIEGVDSEKTLKGYNSDEIPVFEMKDGFSTFDLAKSLDEIEGGTLDSRITFRDIPIKDSKELFETVISPFLDGLKPYQKKNANYDQDYTPQEQEIIKSVINTLIIFDPNDTNTLPVDVDDDSSYLSVNKLLDKSDDEDDDAMNDDTNRKIITACIMNMKHSEYGNLMPIPLDGQNNRIPTDAYGRPLESGRLIYIYDVDDDGKEYYDVKDSETGRAVAMPDYEVIMCTNSLAYAYKYSGAKWVEHSLGITDETAQKRANTHNTAILRAILIDGKGFSDLEEVELTKKLESIVDYYHDDLIVLDRLLNSKTKNKAKIVKLIDKYNEHNVTSWDTFWIKLANYLKLSPTGTAKANDEVVELVTAKETLLPDGNTIQTRDFNYILTRGGYMLLLTVAACVAAIIAALISAHVAAEFSSKIRLDIFGKVETFALNEFDKFSTASLITRSTNDINQIQTVFLLILRTALIAPVTIIGGVILAGQKSAAMTFNLLYPFPILVVASIVAAKVVFPLFTLIQTKVDRLTLIMREGITGIRVVRAFNQQARERDRFQEVNETLTRLSIKVNRYVAVLAPLIAVCMNCTMVAIVWTASKQIANNEDINVGDMMAVIQYITQIMLALVMLATVFVMFPRASASAQRINQVMETDLSILDPENPENHYLEVGTVKFENVCFKYVKDASKNVLADISFTAERGKVTAIVGGTGSGKSSIINLIPRFYDIDSGQIYIDGIPIKDIPQEELRSKIGFVPQRSMLFSGTIRSNLEYGKEDATEDDLWEALDIAQSSAFVKDKENGLESRVEQGGRNFSGGQKQRLSIARAIIRKPEILIFDDSFSALDFRTDKNLRKALKRITTDSATIIVAQRIGTIMDADDIIVLDDGVIVGKGKHEHLIKNCTLYRDIALSQMSEEELGL
ncbi:MAG: ABC transporter ATP-binding protein/permease [Christensenellaceae bacterium]|jgi:ATP-binding cassette subfamily B protein|nr:ABC transporter ATP-binding protein/permease [Christensenellaceae bacterium]